VKHLGIITPLIPEAKCFIASPASKKPIQVAENISLIVSGEGKINTSESVIKLLDIGVDGLMIIGMAGALDPELSPGDLVIPEVVMTKTNQLYHCHREWSIQLRNQINISNKKIVDYPLFTSDEVIVDALEKKQTYEQFNTCAVDMESAAVVALANEHEVPCLVIRAIIDPAYYIFPDYLIALTDEYGKVPVFDLAMASLTRPRQLGRLLRLSGYYRQAYETLKLLAKNPEILIASPH
jgi:adenosylhomocysteine nucleosidase